MTNKNLLEYFVDYFVEIEADFVYLHELTEAIEGAPDSLIDYWDDIPDDTRFGLHIEVNRILGEIFTYDV